MPRGPLIIESPMGRLYLLDLGGGASMLVIEQDGEAMSYPLDGKESSAVGLWLGAKAAGRSRPRQTVSRANAIDYEEVARLYESEEATQRAGLKGGGGRTQYLADYYGVPVTTTRNWVTRARELGFITGDYQGGTKEPRDAS